MTGIMRPWCIIVSLTSMMVALGTIGNANGQNCSQYDGDCHGCSLVRSCRYCVDAKAMSSSESSKTGVCLKTVETYGNPKCAMKIPAYHLGLTCYDLTAAKQSTAYNAHLQQNFISMAAANGGDTLAIGSGVRPEMASGAGAAMDIEMLEPLPTSPESVKKQFLVVPITIALLIVALILILLCLCRRGRICGLFGCCSGFYAGRKMRYSFPFFDRYPITNNRPDALPIVYSNGEVLTNQYQRNQNTTAVPGTGVARICEGVSVGDPSDKTKIDIAADADADAVATNAAAEPMVTKQLPEATILSPLDIAFYTCRSPTNNVDIAETLKNGTPRHPSIEMDSTNDSVSTTNLPPLEPLDLTATTPLTLTIKESGQPNVSLVHGNDSHGDEDTTKPALAISIFKCDKNQDEIVNKNTTLIAPLIVEAASSTFMNDTGSDETYIRIACDDPPTIGNNGNGHLSHKIIPTLSTQLAAVSPEQPA